MLLTFPLMAAIRNFARVGRVTGHGSPATFADIIPMCC